MNDSSVNSKPVMAVKLPAGLREFRRRNAAARRLLNEWRREDSKLTKDTWPKVESILKRYAMSYRKRNSG